MEENITRKSSTGLDENVAGLLCYLLGWVTGVVFFFIEKESRFVRFHAIQSIITFLALQVIFWILGQIWLGWVISFLLWIVQGILWLVLMFKAYQGEMFKLPVAGDIAEKNATPPASA